MWINGVILVLLTGPAVSSTTSPPSDEHPLEVILDWLPCAEAIGDISTEPFLRIIGEVTGFFQYGNFGSLQTNETEVVDEFRKLGMGSHSIRVQLQPELYLARRQLTALDAMLMDGVPDTTAFQKKFEEMSQIVEEYIMVKPVPPMDMVVPHAVAQHFRNGMRRDDAIAKMLSLYAVLQMYTLETSSTVPDIQPWWLPMLCDDLFPAGEINDLWMKLIHLAPCVDAAEVAKVREPIDMEMVLENMPVDWEAYHSKFNDPGAQFLWPMASSVGAHLRHAWMVFNHKRDETSLQHINVAVIDTECSMDNPDLEFFEIPEPHCVVGDPNTIGKTPITTCKAYNAWKPGQPVNALVGARLHGTSVAGIIASKANNGLGVIPACPMCKVHCIRAADDNSRLTSSSLLLAYDYLLMFHEYFPVSNHSYGGVTYLTAEFNALQRLQKVGHIMVIAAGNSACAPGDDGCDSFYAPAMYPLPNIISVGASNIRGEATYFSNHGDDLVDVYAPGYDILVLTSQTNPNQMGLQHGTSFAAPYVASAVAMIRALRPAAPAELIVRKVVDGATRRGPQNLRLLDSAEMMEQVIHELEFPPTTTTTTKMPATSAREALSPRHPDGGWMLGGWIITLVVVLLL
ncbi:MAG: hypothetical protein KVP17_000862 [Porospora cf. gigantea B]|uniref:uncharacterized protein n=2 Tax=Porospora cf. gigantea B TaxID=2853592 RepID=UPI003571F5BB|nr:MAG: hypothetical protein KVP17_000862 [Porospora cf. gigantea B]